jgi:hypothetical protein
MKFEIFGLTLSLGWYIVVFFICSLINVALNTLKTIIMHKEEKTSSTIINAITYGFYAIIVVMTASALDLWITILITILANAIGVYGSMWVLEKFKQDSLWEIVATVQNVQLFPTQDSKSYLEDVLSINKLSFNCIETNKPNEYVYHIYSENQYQSNLIKSFLDNVSAKYIVHEERVKL